MTSLINKIEQLIKREKTTPEKKQKDDSKKSSNEILSELFGAFNAAPPKIEDVSSKKSKKSKKKHKKEKKKRSRSYSSSSDSDSDYSHKRKKRKKSKSRKHRDRSLSRRRSKTPTKIVPKLEPTVKNETISVKSEDIKPKVEKIKVEVSEKPRRVSVVDIDSKDFIIDTSLIPVPESPKEEADCQDLRLKLDAKKGENTSESDKAKGKIQIKNLKFSAVFEETVKKAEEEARRKAEKYEDGEYTDSSSSSKDEESNSQFPKSSDPGGILQKVANEIKITEDEKSSSKKIKHSESSHKSSRTEKSKSRKRSESRSRRRSRSRSPRRRRRSRSRSRHRERSPRARRRSLVRYSSRARRSSRSPGVKLADSEKKRLLEVARRNAINMLKNGAVPAGAAALPLHARTQVIQAIQSGGKSVDELTDFCKHLSKKEALGELSSVSSNDEDISENEDTLAFHHPFLVKEKAPIVMNIRGGAPLPIKSAIMPIANKEELRLQFPVSSGSQHREKSTEWVPVSPPKKDMQVAKLSSFSGSSKSSKPALPPVEITSSPQLALPAPAPAPVAPPTQPYSKTFTSGTTSTSIPALPAPGPQAYPPGVKPPPQQVIDMASIVTQKLSMIRKEQEQSEQNSAKAVREMLGIRSNFGFSTKALGQFTGSTGAQILTPKELASGTQAWAKKDQLQRAAPVAGGMGMQLLQKMGWTPGQGLGKEGTGTLQPLLLEVKLDTRGLTSKEENPQKSGKLLKHQRQKARLGGGPSSGPLVSGGKHPVSLLGEYCSKHKLGPPEYTLCYECGPDHKKNFLFKVKVAGTEYLPAVASANKKQAKADSATLALQKLGILT